MDWLWIIVALLGGMVIGYWLAQRAIRDELGAAAEAPAPMAMSADPVAPAPAAAEPDDLTKIEGIGPKVAGLMNGGGIATFARLAASSVDGLQEILNAAGDRYRVHDPASWPMQAGLAADGKWDKLGELQDRLDGGKLS